MVVLGRYDPASSSSGTAQSDHLVYVLEGELTIGRRRCPAGTLVVLEVGAVFGPLVAGANGALCSKPGPAIGAGARGQGRLPGATPRARHRALPPPRIVRPATAPGGVFDPRYG